MKSVTGDVQSTTCLSQKNIDELHRKLFMDIDAVGGGVGMAMAEISQKMSASGSVDNSFLSALLP